MKIIISFSLLQILLFLTNYPAWTAEFTVKDSNELREAIQEANINGEDDIVNILPGIYMLSGAQGEDNGLLGDLDIRSNLSLRGGDPRNTILKGGGQDRILDIQGNISVQIENLTLSNGYLSEGSGAAIFIGSNADVEIRNCQVVNNTNEFNDLGPGAAAIHNENGTLLVSKTTIAGNKSVFKDAGGILHRNGALEINNSTISGNLVNAPGGGVETINGTALILDSTITQNKSIMGQGGGIANSTADVTIGNSIIAENSSAFLDTDDLSGTFISNGGNIIGDNGFTTTIKFFTVLNQQPSDQIGTSDNPIDPMLGTLQNNGGPTDTHALLPDSPALNTGEDANCPAEDQRGVGRPLGGQCDVGAFEEGCGDGTLESPQEECDDHNHTNSDGCSSICKDEILGGGANNPNGGGCNMITHNLTTQSSGGGAIWVLFGSGYVIFRRRCSI